MWRRRVVAAAAAAVRVRCSLTAAPWDLLNAPAGTGRQQTNRPPPSPLTSKVDHSQHSMATLGRAKRQYWPHPLHAFLLRPCQVDTGLPASRRSRATQYAPSSVARVAWRQAGRGGGVKACVCVCGAGQGMQGRLADVRRARKARAPKSGRPAASCPGSRLACMASMAYAAPYRPSPIL